MTWSAPTSASAVPQRRLRAGLERRIRARPFQLPKYPAVIDRDKSMSGAASDFAAALPRLKVGGIVVNDDLFSLPRLWRIWNKVIEGDTRYVDWKYRNAGFGVAAAVRISE